MSVGPPRGPSALFGDSARRRGIFFSRFRQEDCDCVCATINDDRDDRKTFAPPGQHPPHYVYDDDEHPESLSAPPLHCCRCCCRFKALFFVAFGTSSAPVRLLPIAAPQPFHHNTASSTVHTCASRNVKNGIADRFRAGLGAHSRRHRHISQPARCFPPGCCSTAGQDHRRGP